MIKFIKSLYLDYIIPVCKELGKLIKYVIGIESKNSKINTAPVDNEQAK